MNDNFIEEENTVYEIDPDCQIGRLKKEDGRWKGQSCGSGCFSDCRPNDCESENRSSRKEKNNSCPRDCGRDNDNGCPKEEKKSNRDDSRGGSCRENSCRENNWPWREADNDSRERCQRKNGCNSNWWILIILFWCFCHRE